MKKNSKTVSRNRDRITRDEMRRGVMGKYSSNGKELAARTIILDQDVAQDFRTSKEVNDLLRLVKQMRRVPGKTKKSA